MKLRKVGGPCSSKIQCPAALTLRSYKTLLSGSLAGTLDTTDFNAASPGVAVLGQVTLCDHAVVPLNLHGDLGKLPREAKVV